MQILFLIFLLEIIFLYFLSRRFVGTLGQFLFHTTKNHNSVMGIFAFIFLPGTLIHELAHLFMAKLLFVYAGKIELKPQTHQGGIKLGSAQIGQSDPIRRMLIGFAPVFVGIALLFGIIYLTLTLTFFQHISFSWPIYLIIFYLVFAVSNTMFSSKKDMEGSLEAFGIIILVSAALYYTNLYQLLVIFNYVISPQLLNQVIKQLDLFLVVPLAIDFILWGLFKLVIKQG